jgi:type IV secretory pathway TraG/TraD family ATPase VirD4
MRAQLKVLLSSDYGELLMAPTPTLDLAEAYRARQIVYFALPVSRFPETAPLVAKLIIGDLNGVAGRVQDGELEKSATAVVVDEFASFAMPTFVDLLNKARSAGMAITIAHQSMRGDLAGAGEGYADRVADNTNIKICLRQSEDAEYVAGLGGTYHTTKRTDQLQDSLFGQERTGLGSVREVDEYVVSPNVVRELPPGWAVVKINQPCSYIDLVALDFIATSGLPPYTPPQREAKAGLGLDLRHRASPRALPPPPHRIEPSAPQFDGA